MVCTDLILTQSRGFGVPKNGFACFSATGCRTMRTLLTKFLKLFIISGLHKAGLTSGGSLCFIFCGYAGYKCFTI